MSEEIRQLATAVTALADSNRGIGGVLQAQVESQRETNRFLSVISNQNAQILELMEKNEGRHQGSERNIRAVKLVVDRHGERLGKVEEALGILPPAAE